MYPLLLSFDIFTADKQLIITGSQQSYSLNPLRILIGINNEHNKVFNPTLDQSTWIPRVADQAKENRGVLINIQVTFDAVPFLHLFYFLLFFYYAFTYFSLIFNHTKKMLRINIYTCTCTLISIRRALTLQNRIKTQER